MRRTPLNILCALLVVPAVCFAAGQAQATPRAGDTASLATLEKLKVEPEYKGRYDRKLFPTWDKLSNGCYVREQVLKDESVSKPVLDRWGCKVVIGKWLSVYDGKTVTSSAEIEIDHVVALAEAWDSGAWAWSSAKRRAYANDLSDPRTLRAVTSQSNQAKSAYDPAQWLPVAAARCQYAADWVSVKAKWSLSVDSSEKNALLKILSAC